MVLSKAYRAREKKPINQSNNKKKLKNSKVIRKLLLTITIANSKWFIPKNKLNTYTVIFIKLYN